MQNKITEFANSATRILQAILLVILISFVISNWGTFSDFIYRALRQATEISVRGVITISIPTRQGTSLRTGNWVASYRVKGDKIRIHKARFDDIVTGEEFIEVEALSYVNLSGGFIGDADELMYLSVDDGNLRLDRGDIVRIYTFKKDYQLDDAKARMKKVMAKCLVPYKDKCDGERRKKGMFKTSIGAGDRIVILNSEREILLDLDYWLISPCLPSKE